MDIQFSHKSGVWTHKSGSGILLNAKPRFAPEDVIIPFFTGPNGLQYLQEFVLVEDRAVAMVGGRVSQLSEAEITHISLSHPSPSIMKRLHLVATDIPKHRHLNKFQVSLMRGSEDEA